MQYAELKSATVREEGGGGRIGNAAARCSMHGTNVAVGGAVVRGTLFYERMRESNLHRA